VTDEAPDEPEYAPPPVDLLAKTGGNARAITMVVIAVLGIGVALYVWRTTVASLKVEPEPVERTVADPNDDPRATPTTQGTEAQ
jgi:uncharacterized protein HemX